MQLHRIHTVYSSIANNGGAPRDKTKNKSRDKTKINKTLDDIRMTELCPSTESLGTMKSTKVQTFGELRMRGSTN